MNQTNKGIALTHLVVAAIGLVVGFASLVFGVITITGYKYAPDWVRSSIVFGADYYTDSYKAMAAAANNLAGLTDMLNLLANALGYILIIAGLTLLLIFIRKLIISIIELVNNSKRLNSKSDINLNENTQGEY